MSHFAVLVFVRPENQRFLGSTVENVLGRYDENLETEQVCDCVALCELDHCVKPDPECLYCQGTGVSHFNPDGKWDWWRIGGRYDGWITDTEVSGDGFNFSHEHESLKLNSRPVAELLDKIPCAIVTPDGEWHENPDPWGDDSTGEWDDEVHALYKQYQDCIAVCVDCHV